MDSIGIAVMSDFSVWLKFQESSASRDEKPASVPRLFGDAVLADAFSGPTQPGREYYSMRDKELQVCCTLASNARVDLFACLQSSGVAVSCCR